jgi:hypothetical protein
MQNNQNRTFLVIALIAVGIFLARHYGELRDLLPVPLTIPVPEPVVPPSPEVQQLMTQLMGQIAGDDAHRVAAVLAAAAVHVENDGVVHNPPFVADGNDAKTRIENIGDLVCGTFRLGTKYPGAVNVLATYLEAKVPTESDFNRQSFAVALKVCADALKRL